MENMIIFPISCRAHANKFIKRTKETISSQPTLGVG